MIWHLALTVALGALAGELAPAWVRRMEREPWP